MPDDRPPLQQTLSATLLDEVINAGVHGVIVIDAQEKITLWNQWMEKTSCIDANTALNATLNQLFPALENGRLHNSIKAALKSGKSSIISHAFSQQHLPLYRPEHNEQRLEQTIYVKPINTAHAQRYCLVQICDISAAMKRERQLRDMAHNAEAARQAAEEYSELKSGFVSTVSHELRTPLTAIHGSLSLLNSQLLNTNIDERAKSLIEIASNNSSRLLMLVNDILDIEKIESGKMEYNFAQVEIKALLKQALLSIHDYGRQRDVGFEIEHAPHDTFTQADSNRLLQVMNNLLSNAAKFEPKSGTVKIRADIKEEKVRISVKDHGPGIPQTFQDQIFNKFTQADHSNTRSIPGTGLGLAIAKAIIHEHQGEIGFHTSPQGTEFFIFLPLLSQPEVLLS